MMVKSLLNSFRRPYHLPPLPPPPLLYHLVVQSSTDLLSSPTKTLQLLLLLTVSQSSSQPQSPSPLPSPQYYLDLSPFYSPFSPPNLASIPSLPTLMLFRLSHSLPPSLLSSSFYSSHTLPIIYLSSPFLFLLSVFFFFTQ